MAPGEVTSRQHLHKHHRPRAGFHLHPLHRFNSNSSYDVKFNSLLVLKQVCGRPAAPSLELFLNYDCEISSRTTRSRRLPPRWRRPCRAPTSAPARTHSTGVGRVPAEDARPGGAGGDHEAASSTGPRGARSSGAQSCCSRPTAKKEDCRTTKRRRTPPVAPRARPTSSTAQGLVALAPG